MQISKAGGFSDVTIGFLASEGGTGVVFGYGGNASIVPTATLTWPDQGEFNVQFNISINFTY